MEIVSAAEMAAIENEAMSRQGITVSELMALAGKAIADLAAELIEPDGEVAVYTGKGNNGGDGFVAARHLAARGYKVTVVKLGAPPETGPARPALEALKEASVKVIDFDPLRCLTPDLVIDAVLGFGLKGDLRGSARQVVEQINSIKAIKLAVDIPSGVNSDTGMVAGVAVRADHTITFTVPKIGMVVYPGAELCGRVRCGDIGIAPETIRDLATVRLADDAMVRSLIPRRAYNTNKHKCGRVLAVAGSAGMTGAAAMTAMAAMRAGAGIVTLAAPASLNDIFEVKLTEVMTVPLPETDQRTIAAAAVDSVLALARRFDVVALGPGLSRHPETVEFTRLLLERLETPVVVDADAITNIAGTDIISGRSAPTIITPHSGELSRLTGWEVEEIEADRVAAAKRAAAELRVTVVLKGSRTVVSGRGATMVIPTGNPGMATAGTGDVLTGVIAALMAQGLPDYPAAVTGAYLHGLAGDLAARNRGELAMIATDLIDCLPEAIKKIEGKGEEDKDHPS